MYETTVVPRFDGGLNFAGHPAAIQDAEWTWSSAFEPRDGCALQMVDAVQAIDTSWVSGLTPVGVVTDVASAISDRVFLVSQLTGGGNEVNVRYFNPPTAATVLVGTSTTSDAVLATASSRPHITPVSVATLQVIAAGGKNGFNTVVTISSALALADVDPTLNLNGQYCASAAGHAIVCGDFATPSHGRHVNISDANDPSTTGWDPTVGNSADELDLDAAGLIAAAIETVDGVAIITTSDTIYARATGGDPPFSFSRIHGGGMGAMRQWAAHTPIGTLAWIGGRITQLGGGVAAGGEKCSTYLVDKDIRNFQQQSRMKWVWDDRRGALIIAKPSASGVFSPERMYFDPVRGVWWRKPWEYVADDIIDHTTGAQNETGSGVASGGSYYYLAENGTLYWERAFDPDGSTSGTTGAFVDTKDFAFSDPSIEDFIDRIQVDWEPLTGVGDTLKVYAYVREELFPDGFVGTRGLNTDFTAYFEDLGTLAAGERQLTVNKRGRYARFRFAPQSGRCRIRGFSIRRQRGSDRSA